MKLMQSIVLLSCILGTLGGGQSIAANRSERAVVKVLGADSVGSGFIFNKGTTETYILTVGHVVKGSDRIEVEFGASPGSRAQSRVFDTFLRAEDDDAIAVLVVPTSAVPARASSLVLSYDYPGFGDDLSVVGFPRAIDFISIVHGELTARRRSDLVFSNRLDEGFSGSPVLQDGRAVGIVIASAAYNRSLAASMASIEDELAYLQPRRLFVSFLGQWGSEGEATGQLSSPWGIAADFSGEQVYVAEWGVHRVQVFSKTGRYRDTLKGDNDVISGNFVAVNSNGQPYALDYDSWNGQNQRILVFGFYGEGIERTIPLGDVSPRSIDTDVYGEDIFITDIGRSRVMRFDKSGELLLTWGGQGVAPGDFIDPWGIAVDRYRNRRVYVADTGNHRIQVFTRDGNFVAAWGSHGSGEGQFNRPIDVAVDSEGDVYVLEGEGARVQIFSPEGRFLGLFGGKGSGPGEFLDPYGISVDGRGVVYVSDTGNHRVQYFAVSDTP